MASRLFSDSLYMQRIVSMAQGANAGAIFVPCMFCNRYVKVANVNKNVCKVCARRNKKFTFAVLCYECRLKSAYSDEEPCAECNLRILKRRAIVRR